MGCRTASATIDLPPSPALTRTHLNDAVAPMVYKEDGFRFQSPIHSESKASSLLLFEYDPWHINHTLPIPHLHLPHKSRYIWSSVEVLFPRFLIKDSDSSCATSWGRGFYRNRRCQKRLLAPRPDVRGRLSEPFPVSRTTFLFQGRCRSRCCDDRVRVRCWVG